MKIPFKIPSANSWRLMGPITLCFVMNLSSYSSEPYLDKILSIEVRIDDLLTRMTLEEKIGQMTQIDIAAITKASGIDETGEKKKTVELDEAKFIDLIERYKVGNFVNGDAVDHDKWATYIKRLQELTLEHSRLQIPIIYGMDHIHGANNVYGATMFPQSINMAATFDPVHTENEAKSIGIECAHLGHAWIYSPVLGLGKNPFWPRFFETYGEDPHLASVLADRFVHTLQENPQTRPYKQAACAKHFLGYSDPRSGWDRTPAMIPDQQLYEFFVPAFQAAIDAGVKTVMINSAEINGIPVHASHDILTELLRSKLGFKGVAMTDWGDIERLYTWHHTAPTVKEAVFQAVTAGIDVSLTPHDPQFADLLKELVNEGRISQERIDLSVQRILRLKMELGLFDDARFPIAGEPDEKTRAKYQQKSKEATLDSIVLLKNEGILPIKPGRKILVVGEFAKTRRALCGGWTYVWFARSDKPFPKEMQTLYSALQDEFGTDSVDYATLENFDQKSQDADLILSVISSEPYAELLGNFTDQVLHGVHAEIAQKVMDSGIANVTVVIEGRPLLVTDIFDATDAFIWAGLPGYYGGGAIAQVLSGKWNPNGKLPFSYPAYPLHFSPYNRKWMETLVYHEDINPRISLADFGSGLSYSQFEYSDLELSTKQIAEDEKLVAKIRVKNTGPFVGKETIMWFLKDDFASITRPIRELAHFEKTELEVNESKVFEFVIEPRKHLTFPDKTGDVLLEKGTFTLMVGDLETSFTLN